MNRNEYSHDGIIDSVIDLLAQSRVNDQDIYLVYSESDPDLTVELNDGSFIIRIKNQDIIRFIVCAFQRFTAIVSKIFPLMLE